MQKTLEEVIRENSQGDSPVGNQFIVRVLEDHKDHLDISIRPENRDGDTVDFAVEGNNLMNYEEA